MIKGCDWLLKNKDCANDNNEVNEVIEVRNYFIRKLDLLTTHKP
jgi:hypothetical protein